MAPQISPFKISEDLSEGRRLSLVCSVTLGTPPMSFTWLKDGKSLGDLPNVKLVHLDDFQDQLQIEKLGAEHAGNYTCNAKNAYGSDRMAVQVSLKFAPRWKSDEKTVQGVAGGLIRIDCAALGHPEPQLEVYKGEFRPISSLEANTSSIINYQYRKSESLKSHRGSRDETRIIVSRFSESIRASSHTLK